MAERAVVVKYRGGEEIAAAQFDAAGNPILYITVLLVDTADSTRSKSIGVMVTLDATNPAGWTAAIKAAIVATANNDAGFPALVSTNVFIPAYA